MSAKIQGQMDNHLEKACFLALLSLKDEFPSDNITSDNVANGHPKGFLRFRTTILISSKWPLPINDCFKIE